LRDLLISGALELGVELSDLQVERFFIYMGELRKWNRKINLTAISGEREIIERHFLDSLVLSRYLVDDEKVLDMGSGAGLPGIALKIANSSLDVTLMDKVEKKAVFLRHIIRTLELGGVRVLSARAEDKGAIEEYGAFFDVVLSRAFSGLKEFLSLSFPYLRPGGRIIAVKGPRSKELEEETEEALKAFEGLYSVDIIEKALPFSARLTTLITFKGWI